MVFTIHRYIFRDLLKTFFLAAVVLSVVLGLGMMLRPLREFGVDPARVPQLVLLTLPITLTMVIPVAALLSATLNYGRLAVDNEINACRSSGIGLLTPHVGAVLFIGSAVGKVSIERVVKATLPFYILMIITLILVTFIPSISLFLPSLFK